MDTAVKSPRIDSGWATGLYEALRQRWHRRVVYLQTLEDLEQMDDRELEDVGLSYAMLPDVAREASRAA